MKATFIAIGDALRRDGGAPQRVLELLGPVKNVLTHSCLRLTAEMAEEIAAAEAVVFIDAEAVPGPARLELLEPRAAWDPSHSACPAELLALARERYLFRGCAYICHVPGVDFSEGTGLTPAAEANARVASELLAALRL